MFPQAPSVCCTEYRQLEAGDKCGDHTAAVQAREGGGLNSGGSKRDADNWLDSGFIFNIQPTRLADGLDIEWGEKREAEDDLKIFDLGNWKDELGIN